MINNISLQNIRIFSGNTPKSLSFKSGITVITGNNRSGKSTILNSIQWAVSDTLEVPLGLFRSMAGGEDPSYVLLDVDGIQIKKFILPLKGDYHTKIEIIKNGESLTFPNVTAGKNYILNYLGISPPTFNNGIFLGQQADIALLTRPSTAKDFLFRLFELNKYEDINTRIKESILELGNFISNLQGRIHSGKDRMLDYKGVENTSILVDQIQELEDSIKNWKEILSRMNIKELLKIQAEREFIQSKLNGFCKSCNSYNGKEKTQITSQIEKLEYVKKIIIEGMSSLSSMINHYNNILDVLIEGSCPICDRKLTAGKVNEVKERSESLIKTYKEEHNELKSYLKDLDHVSKSLNSDLHISTQMDIHKRNIEELAQKVKSLRDVKDEISSYHNTQEKIASTLQELTLLKNTLDKIISYQEDKQKILKYELDLLTTIERKERLLLLKDAYGRDGIPKFIMETQLDALRTAINDNLRILSEDELELEFILFAEGKETFEIIIRDGLFRKPISVLSGGERQRVLLACAFGLADYIQTPIRWRVGDEIDASLDTDGIISLKRLIESKRNKYDQLILASPKDNLRDVADHIIEL